MLSIPQAYKRPALRLLVCFETLQCLRIVISFMTLMPCKMLDSQDTQKPVIHTNPKIRDLGTPNPSTKISPPSSASPTYISIYNQRTHPQPTSESQLPTLLTPPSPQPPTPANHNLSPLIIQLPTIRTPHLSTPPPKSNSTHQSHKPASLRPCFHPPYPYPLPQLTYTIWNQCPHPQCSLLVAEPGDLHILDVDG